MALTVETGGGSTTADSYISVADADTYITDYLGGDSNWTAADTATKERALRVGTAYLENRYRTRWKGRRTSKDQALAFPRYDIITYDGFLLDHTVIPTNLKRAVVEAAVRHLASTTLEPDATPDEQGIKSLSQKLDVISESITFAGSKTTQPFFSKIDRLVSELAYSQGQAPVDRG